MFIPYSSAETTIGKILDIGSYLVVMAIVWAFGIVVVGGFLLTVVCAVIQMFGGHHFLMDAF